MSPFQLSSTCFLSLILLVTQLSGDDCPLDGYLITSESDEECSNSVMTCSEGTNAWSIQGCGCGCKPECVVEGHSIMSNSNDICKNLEIECPVDYQPWNDTDCGCGCAPNEYYAALSTLSCVPEGGTMMTTNADLCPQLHITCPSGQEKWFDSSCGCGCVLESGSDTDSDYDAAHSLRADQHDFSLEDVDIRYPSHSATQFWERTGSVEDDHKLRVNTRVVTRIIKISFWILAICSAVLSVVFMAKDLMKGQVHIKEGTKGVMVIADSDDDTESEEWDDDDIDMIHDI